MNTFIRNLLTASVVSAVLGSGAGFAMAETSQTPVYLQNSVEIGHAGWNWWANSRPAADSELCTHDRVTAQSIETGPITWDWWRDSPVHEQAESAAATLQVQASNSSETGHVRWNWWEYPSSASKSQGQQC